MQDMSVPHSQPGSQPSDADEVFQPSSPNEDSSSLSASCLEEELPQYVSLYSSSKADFAYTSTLTEESLEDHGMLRERIDKCRTIAECVQIYQDELYQKCLSKIENAQKEEREAMEKQNVPKKDDLFMFRVREAWSKKWATAMVNNEEWAMTFEKCRMTGLRLLLRLCDCWQEDRTVIEADIVKKFKKEKVERIFLLCLPLDRANSLFKMVSTKTGVRGLHWYANVHTEWKDLNGGTINKRYMMLYGIRGLNLESNQEIKMWFEPKAAHKTTTVIANNTTQKGDTQLGEGIRQRRGAAKQSNIDVTRCQQERENLDRQAMVETATDVSLQHCASASLCSIWRKIFRHKCASTLVAISSIVVISITCFKGPSFAWKKVLLHSFVEGLAVTIIGGLVVLWSNKFFNRRDQFLPTRVLIERPD